VYFSYAAGINERADAYADKKLSKKYGKDYDFDKHFDEFEKHRDKYWKTQKQKSSDLKYSSSVDGVDFADYKKGGAALANAKKATVKPNTSTPFQKQYKSGFNNIKQGSGFSDDRDEDLADKSSTASKANEGG